MATAKKTARKPAKDSSVEAEKAPAKENSEDVKAQAGTPRKGDSLPQEDAPAPETAPEAGAQPVTEPVTEPVTDPETAPETAPETEAETAPETTPETGPQTIPAPRRKSVFLPMVLGGAVAAGLGFGAAYYLLPQGQGEQTRAALTAQQQALEAAKSDLGASLAQASGQLRDEAAALKKAQGDIAALRGDLEARSKALSDRIGAVSARIDKLQARLLTIEKRPVADAGGAASAAVAAYEGELKAMRTQLAQQRAQIEKLAADVTKRIASARQQANELAQATQASATKATARIAISRINAALETGGGFASALKDFTRASGQPAPKALTEAAQTGVPTLGDLQARFPAAARAALAASLRAAPPSGAVGRLEAFLKAQTGARSLKPRPGNDPDAILSRAEDALKHGQLDKALALVASLPEAGQAAMADWSALVKKRADALAAAKRLADSLNQK